jgi:hypothetical protein
VTYEIQSLVLWFAALLAVLGGLGAGRWWTELLGGAVGVLWLGHLFFGHAYLAARRMRLRWRDAREHRRRRTRAASWVLLYGRHLNSCPVPLDEGAMRRGDIRKADIRECTCGFSNATVMAEEWAP